MILPNYGKDATLDGIRRVAEAAEELRFDSVWATEHIIVGAEAADTYGRVYDPLVTLGWVAGWTERIGLGTSIVLVPLHNPIHLAKEVATLQELSGGRFTLGVGMGWHEDEFDFMGVEFKGRGRRANEAIRLMRALWSGERDFDGEYWSFHDATSEPHPSPQPEIWVGGSSDRAIRRALELGDAWHPSRGSDADHVSSSSRTRQRCGISRPAWIARCGRRERPLAPARDRLRRRPVRRLDVHRQTLATLRQGRLLL